MAVRYIIGGTGQGKSELCFKKIVEEAEKNLNKNYFVIVPEQFTLQTQRDLVRLSSGKAIMNIDVLSFMRLAYRVFEELNIKERLILEDTGKNMVIRKLLGTLKKELKYYNNVVGKQGFTEDVKSLLSELMQYGITPDRLEEIESKTNSQVLAAKLHDTSLIYKAFNNYKKEKYISAEQILEVLANEIGKSKLLENVVICFDGYTGFTPVQLKVIDLLLTKADDLFFTLTISKKDYESEENEKFRLFHLSKDTIRRINRLAEERGVKIASPVVADFDGKVKTLSFLEQQIFRYPIKIFEPKEETVSINVCKNPKEEVERLIPRILSMVRDEGLRYRDIALVAGSIEEYGEIAFDTLSKYGIPCFLDSKKTIADNPFVEYIKASILVVEENFSYEAVMRYLRSGFSNIDMSEADIFENYILRRGIKGHKKYSKSFVNAEPSEEEKIAEDIRNIIISAFEPLYETLKSKKSVAADFVKALYEFIWVSGSEKRLLDMSAAFEAKGKMIAAKEYAGCYKIVMSVFEKLYELLGDEKLSIEEFRNILESGFSEGKAGFIPSGLDRIVIGDVERTRLKDIKVLFCLGFNEGKVPRASQVRGIITDSEKEKLESLNVELAPTAKERAFREQFYIYMLFSKPAKRLYVSYSSLDMEGKPLKPSYFVERLRQIFKKGSIEGTKGASLLDTIRKDGGMELIIEAIRNKKLEDNNTVSLIKYYQSNPDDRYNKIIAGAFAKAHGNSLESYVAENLYGELKGSVTRLELFSSCAYAHFIKHGLRLKERKEFELRPMDAGNVLHEALERFAKKILERGESFASISKEVREAVQAESIAETFNYGDDIFNASFRNNYQGERLKRITDRAVRTVLSQLQSGDFTPIGIEEEFVTKGFKGRIDRIDSVLSDYLPDGKLLVDSKEYSLFNKAEYIRVIDYKSGNKTLDLDRAYYGLDLQLFTYLDYVRKELGRQAKHKNNLIIPSGAYYFHIDDPVIDFGQGEEAILKSMRLDGITLGGKHHISLVDREMADMSGFTASADSGVIKLKTKKDGEPSGLTRLYNRDEMNKLIDNSELEIEKSKKKILEGEISPLPYSLGGAKGCDYCEYKGICGFDLKLDGYNYNRLKVIGKSKFFEELDNKLEGKNGNKLD